MLALLAALVLAVAQGLIYLYAPLEATMGLTQKIFYTHLPMAWWCMLSFVVVFVASLMYLRGRNPARDRLAQAAAEIGVLFGFLALVSGSIWGKAAWGVWWTWDPRLTTTLIMVLTYAGYLVLRTAPMGPDKRSLACAVLGIVAFLDVPLVFVSARMWRSIHPAVIGAKGGGMEPEMWTAMIVALAGAGLFWLALLNIRLRLLKAEREAATLFTELVSSREGAWK